MFPVAIETERLMLREFTLADADEVHEFTGVLEVVHYMPLGPTTDDDVVDYVRGLIAQAEAVERQGYTLAIHELDTNVVVGAVSLTIDSRVHRRAEIGYVLRKDRWGRGYATEAAAAIVAYAIQDLGMHRVWAVCDPDNPASARVLEKIGMEHEGVLRHDLRVRGQWRDSILYAVLADDWPGVLPGEVPEDLAAS